MTYDLNNPRQLRAYALEIALKNIPEAGLGSITHTEIAKKFEEYIRGELNDHPGMDDKAGESPKLMEVK